MNTNTTTMTASTTTDTTTATTTDLAVLEKKALDQLTRSAAKDDLDAFLQGARRSLLLVDTSASMNTRLKEGRRIDALRSIVSMLNADAPVPVAAFGWIGHDLVLVVNDIPEPAGGTPLAEAIDFGREQGATHLVVVTDGEPDSDVEAFAAAARFAQPIDVFFTGDAFSQGRRFAEELARRTGGKCVVDDMGQPKALAGKIRLLLGDGN